MKLTYKGKVQKWGNSLVMVIPSDLKNVLELDDCEEIYFEVEEDEKKEFRVVRK